MKESSFAREMPIRRGSFWDSPQPGRMPTRACVSANTAALEAISTSQASASSKPPVMAWPLIAPMIGPSKSRIASSIEVSAAPLRSSAAAEPSSFRSTPALKARPAPVRITTRVSPSFWSARKLCSSACRSSTFSAFSASGRFSVRVATPSARSTWSTVTRGPPEGRERSRSATRLAPAEGG